MYCSNANTDDCTKRESRVRRGLEDLFHSFGVDLILEAHEHSYERYELMIAVDFRIEFQEFSETCTNFLRDIFVPRI